MTDTTRRAVVLGAGGAGLAAVLTACSSYGTAGSGQASEAPAGDQPSATKTKKAKSGNGGAKPLAATSDIPEGGGKVFSGQKIVVVQPKAGEFKAFTAVCTHQGCTVSTVANGTINCPCHGSKYNIADGSVADGPAPKPLAEKKIKVKGGEITLA